MRVGWFVSEQDTCAPAPCSLLARGRLVITDPLLAGSTITDGAVCVQGDTILAAGPYASMRLQFRAEREVGSRHHLVLPGLVNAHDHVRGPSSLQMGIPDDEAELWLLDLMRLPEVDPYLSTAYACVQMIESGVTTVLHSYYEGGADRYEAALEPAARAYSDCGIRAVVALSILDQSIASSMVRSLLPHLPPHLEGPACEFLHGRHPVPVEEYLDVVRRWCASRSSGRLHVMIGPVSVHWCSDELLQRIWQQATDLDLAIQTHLLESRRQRSEALTRYGRSAVEHMEALGLLSRRLSCAHCVWVTERDMDLLADYGVSVVHNPSSNLRLGSGTAPVRAMLARGINIGLGLDSLSLADNGDMIEELRLAALLHRLPDAPSSGAWQALAMATVNGARALGLERTFGTIEPGKRADLVLLDLDRMEAPLGGTLDIAQRMVQRAEVRDVDTVIVNGQIVMHNRKLLTIDRPALAREIRSWWAAQKRSTEQGRMGRFIGDIKPYARRLLHGELGSPGLSRRDQ